MYIIIFSFVYIHCMCTLYVSGMLHIQCIYMYHVCMFMLSIPGSVWLNIQLVPKGCWMIGFTVYTC